MVQARVQTEIRSLLQIHRIIRIVNGIAHHRYHAVAQGYRVLSNR